MKLSIWPRPTHTWADVRRIAERAERLGWEGVWFADHFMPARGDLSPPMLECWATLSGLAAVTQRLRVGALVSGNTYRHPAVLANTAATADHISGGRVVLGIGAGWQRNEHEAYGIGFGTTKERLDRLEEACAVLRGLRDSERLSFDGRHYQLSEAPMEPKPSGQLPLLVGGGGERRTIPIAATHADEWNVWGTVEHFAHKASVLDRACEAIGRDPTEVRRSTQALVVIDEPGLPGTVPEGRRPVAHGSFEALRDLLGRYAEAGAAEFIVPDFHFDTADETIALMDALSEEVAPAVA